MSGQTQFAPTRLLIPKKYRDGLREAFEIQPQGTAAQAVDVVMHRNPGQAPEGKDDRERAGSDHQDPFWTQVENAKNGSGSAELGAVSS